MNIYRVRTRIFFRMLVFPNNKEVFFYIDIRQFVAESYTFRYYNQLLLCCIQ